MPDSGEQAYRKKRYAALHAAVSRLGWDDTEYRAWLGENWGVRSATKLTPAQLGQALDGLNGRKPAFADRPQIKGAVCEGQLRKIDALLAEAGRTWRYAAPLLRRMCRVQTWEWARPDDLRKVIAALVKDQQRRQAKSV